MARQEGDLAVRHGRQEEAVRWRPIRGVDLDLTDVADAVPFAGNAAARVWGLVLLAVGLWLFATITLNLALPNVAWGDLWPLFLIVLGLSVVLGSGRRR